MVYLIRLKMAKRFRNSFNGRYVQFCTHFVLYYHNNIITFYMPKMNVERASKIHII